MNSFDTLRPRLFKIRFNIIISSTPKFPKWRFACRVCHWYFVWTSHLSMHATYSIPLIPLDPISHLILLQLSPTFYHVLVFSHIRISPRCNFYSLKIYRPELITSRCGFSYAKFNSNNRLLFVVLSHYIPLCFYINNNLNLTVRNRIPVETRISARPDRPWGPPSLL